MINYIFIILVTYIINNINNYNNTFLNYYLRPILKTINYFNHIL